MITLTQHAANVAKKAVAVANDPRAMLLPVEARTLLTDFAALMVDMAKQIEKLEGK